MNRQIKFRVWDPDEEIFRQGCYMYSDGTIVSDWGKEKYDWIFSQFTGIVDKNGKEIYEGDIVSVKGQKLYTRNPKLPFTEPGIFYVKYFPNYGVYGLYRDDMNDVMMRWKKDQPLGKSGSSTKYVPYMIGSDYWRTKIEVIGNIFQNSELLIINT